MRISIKQLQIVNFKLFGSLHLRFDDSNLVVLDGPNGFGKTSVFDAIELLITGKIERIERASTQLIDGRSTFADDLLSYREDAPIEIKGEFLKDGKSFVFSRVAEYSPGVPNNFSRFILYRLTNFHQEFSQGQYQRISDGEIENFFGEHIKKFFSLFYYIEQEDSTHFLFQKETDRKKGLETLLLKIGKEETELKKIKTLKSRLQKVKLKQEINNRKEALETLKTELKGLSSSGDIKYENILSGLSLSTEGKTWNLKDPKIENKEILNLFEQELLDLDDFIQNFGSFKQNEINKALRNYSDNLSLLESTIIFHNFRDRIEDFRGSIRKDEKFKKWIKLLEFGKLKIVF